MNYTVVFYCRFLFFNTFNAFTGVALCTQIMTRPNIRQQSRLMTYTNFQPYLLQYVYALTHNKEIHNKPI